jgi:hypothetical protein
VHRPRFVVLADQRLVEEPAPAVQLRRLRIAGLVQWVVDGGHGRCGGGVLRQLEAPGAAPRTEVAPDRTVSLKRVGGTVNVATAAPSLAVQVYSSTSQWSGCPSRKQSFSKSSE